MVDHGRGANNGQRAVPAMSDAPLFGKYELLSTLGSGGMATVHRACLRGPAGAARQVALKVIHPSLSHDPLFVKLFLAETRVAMALSHRNIVQTFDAGLEQGQYFMAMELVSGGTVHQLLKLSLGAGLPLDVALFITMELCSALQYAHELRPEIAGQPEAVVHCDVSPSNILLGRGGEVKLADFGVARARDRLSQTSMNLVKGKLSYMAPEQARGKPEPRSDVFSAGIVLHEMLAGRSLRRPPDLNEVLRGPGEIPRLATLRPEVPAAIDEIVHSCLSADPDARVESALALRKLLSELLFEHQVKAGTGVDSHARLSAYLEESLPPEETAPRIARALAAQALALSEVTEPPPGVEPAAPEREVRRTAPTAVEPIRKAAVPSTEVESGREPRRTAPTAAEPIRPSPIAATAVDGPPAPLAVPAAAVQPAPTASELTPVKRSRLPLLAGTGLLAALVGAGAVMLSRSPAPGPGPAVVPSRPDRGLDRGATARAGDAARLPDGPGSPLTPPNLRRPVGQGELELNALPWAKVYVDGRYVGDTPVQGLKLAAGVRRVRLVNPERGLVKELRITIPPGRRVSRAVVLRPQ
jgi:serine/threonine protein kinase